MSRVKKERFFIPKLGLLFLVTFVIGLLLGSFIKTGDINDTLSFGLSKSYNILVMGTDTANKEENSRSDTMIVVSIDKKSKNIVMVWIPRDTRVEVGKNRYDKINSINFIKGPEEATKAVGKILDLKVDYYVTTSFDGFAKIIDILGGVHIDVPFDMRHYDPDPDLNINLSKGPQILNGQDALRFVRYRGGPTADIGRTVRQQQFIKALAAEMFSTKAVLKLPQLLPEIAKNVHTNIPMKEMLYLAEAARGFDLDKIITQTLPGYPFTDPKNGASYWVADEDIAKGIIKDLFNGKQYDVAQDPPRNIAPQITENQIPADNAEVEETEGQDEELTENDETLGENSDENQEEIVEEIPEENPDEIVDPEEPEEDTEEPEITDPNELPADLTSETVPVTTP
jgi:LCP family protein required for cell wall assembly